MSPSATANPVSATHLPGRHLPGPHGVDKLRRARQLFRDPSTALDSLYETFGPISELRFGPTRIAVIGGSGLLHQMFSMPAESFRWGHKFNMVGVRFVVGKGSMIVSDGKDHRRRRSSVQSSFSRRRLNSWIPMIVARTDAAIDRVAESLDGRQTQLDLYPVGRNLILGITVHAFFGERLAVRADEIGELYERPQQFIEAPLVEQLPHPIPFTARARVRADGRAIAAIIDAEITLPRSHPTGDPFDVLEAIVLEGTLSDTEIRDQVKTLIGAGYDTTASALADQAWVPFGRGPHMCIGFALARMELTLIVARLAQRLDVEPIASETPHPVGMVVNRPTGGAPFKVSARTAC